MNAGDKSSDAGGLGRELQSARMKVTFMLTR
jgi:hypothetical protein